MRAKLSNRDYEQISAYLDGQLPPHEQRRFEDRLRTHPELQAELDDLSRMKMLLRQAPHRRAPHNFTLTPAMVGETPPRRRRGFSLNLFPALSFASALATLALAATILFQLLPGQPLNKTTASAPLAAPAENRTVPTSPTMAAAAQPAAQPLVSATQTAGTGQAQGLAAPESAAGKAPDQSQAGNPPVINWNGPSVAAGGYGGGGGDGTSSVPYLGSLMGPPTASDNSAAKAYGMGGGGGGGVGGPSLIIPPQVATGLPAAAEAQPATTVQPNPAITGNGPILGVPAKDEGGQIIDQKSIQGFPEPGTSTGQTLTRSAVPTQAVNSVADTVFGLPRLTLIQILLGTLAVVTGAAALIIRRSA